nr:tetratricopeptide repeat protein [Lachnospiraceae bacterium]
MNTEEIKTEIDEEKGLAYLAEGRKRFMDNDIRGAINYLQKAAILFDIDNDHENYCETMNVLGVALAANGNDTEALDHYLEGLDCAVQHHIRLSSITILNNIGSKYQELGFDERALEYLLKAAEIIENVPVHTDPRLPLWKLVIDMNIANAYRMLSQYEKARTYLDRAKCEDVWKDEESVRVFYLSYQVSLASLLWDLGEKEKAAEMVPELVELAMKDRNVSNYQQDIMDLLALLERMGDRSHWEVVLQSFEQYASRHDSPDVKIASLEAWLAYFKYFELKDKYKEACVLYTEQSLEMKAYKNRERAEAMDLKISMREKD